MISTTDDSLGQCLWDWIIEQNKDRAKKDTKFIVVTNRDNGKPILVNTNLISSIHEDWSGKTSTTWIETEQSFYAVLESLDFFRGILT